VADITTIIRAWDAYAALRENREELKTVDQFSEAAKANRDGPSKDEILEMKKAWIIKSKSTISQAARPSIEVAYSAEPSLPENISSSK
jgi:hypothetical protein